MSPCDVRKWLCDVVTCCFMLWVFGDITIQIHAVRDDTDRKTVAKTRNQSKHDTDSRHSFDWTSHSQVVAHGCRLTPDVSLVNVEALASRQDEQINVQLQEFQTPKQLGIRQKETKRIWK